MASSSLVRCFWLGVCGTLVGFVLLTFRFRKKRKSDDSEQNDSSRPEAKPSTTPTSKPHPLSVGDGSHVSSHVTTTDDLEAAMVALSKGGILDMKHAELLVSLLSTDDFTLLQRVLVTVANAAAFTSNQNTLREAGCLPQLSRFLHMLSARIAMLNGAPNTLREAGCLPHLSRLLHTQLLCLATGHEMTDTTLVKGVVNALGNLAANEDNQAQIQDCIPALIELTSSDHSSEDLQLASLQALTNLSVTSTFHLPYTQVIQQLYELLDVASNRGVRLQALKVLLNLSCNADIVPHLLAAKAPGCLLDLLRADANEDLLLRWLTILANILSTSRQLNITYATLPTQYKAASPETMYTAIYGLNNSAKLKSKVFVLSRHGNESIRGQATAIYSVMS